MSVVRYLETWMTISSASVIAKEGVGKMAPKMQRRVPSDWLLTLAAALVLFSVRRCSAQLTANRHTLRYDGEVNIGEIGGRGYRSIDRWEHRFPWD